MIEVRKPNAWTRISRNLGGKYSFFVSDTIVLVVDDVFITFYVFV